MSNKRIGQKGSIYREKADARSVVLILSGFGIGAGIGAGIASIVTIVGTLAGVVVGGMIGAIVGFTVNEALCIREERITELSRKNNGQNSSVPPRQQPLLCIHPAPVQQPPVAYVLPFFQPPQPAVPDPDVPDQAVPDQAASGHTPCVKINIESH